MIKFNLSSQKPDSDSLRAYLYQALTSGFGFSESLFELLQDQCGFAVDHHNDLNKLDNEIISNVIRESNLMPERFFWFSEGEFSLNAEYKNFPELFTRIVQVSFDKGGLIVMESFSSQIYQLFNAKGRYLSEYCHDLDLGMNGLVLLRSSDSYFWESYQYNGKKLKDKGSYGPFDSPADFPNIGDRDLIPEMFPDGEFPIKANYPPDNLTKNDVLKELAENEYNYRYLSDFYKDDKELAMHAVNSNGYAFTLLSKRLRSDKQFVVNLINSNENNSFLYKYFCSDLKSDNEIRKLCLKTNPSVLDADIPIDDKEILQIAVEDVAYYFARASDELKNDKEFILKLVETNWRVLWEVPRDILTDNDFILEAVRRFNEVNAKNNKFLPIEQESKSVMLDLPFGDGGFKRRLTLNILVESLLSRNSLVLKHLAPVSDLGYIFKGLPYTDKEDMAEFLSYIDPELKETHEFWVEAVRKSLYAIRHIPEKYRSDRAIALAAVQYHGELIEFLDDEFKKDPDMYLEAISQIVNRRGPCWPGNIMKLLPDELKSNKDFFFNAISMQNSLIRYASDELMRDKEFIMQALKYDPEIFFSIHKDFQEDPGILKEAIRLGFDYDRFLRIKNQGELLF